ncbi:MAG: DUF4340 domain-containing protein [Candidatus Glassbacteria bacterium]|nr:DUF4340 domain-containing protein [Candidatus Glassbacteria bacterium]
MNKFAKPLIVLLILLAAWMAVKVVRRDPSRPDADKALIVSIDTAGISRIVVVRGADSVTVEHGVDGWRVTTEYGKKPAENEVISSALANLGKINTIDVISHNPEKQAEFRVDDASGTHVKLYGPGGGVIEALVIGKMGGFESQQTAIAQGRINENLFHSYIRRAGTDRVYRVKGFFGGMLGTDPEQWRGHNVMKFHPLRLRSVTVESPERTLSLELGSDAVWIMSEPPMPDSMEVDSTAIFRLASSLGSFRASGFVDTTVASTGLESPSLTIHAELVDGTTLDVAVGDSIPGAQNLFYCRRQGSDQLFTIAEFRMNQVNKPPEELLTLRQEESETER